MACFAHEEVCYLGDGNIFWCIKSYTLRCNERMPVHNNENSYVEDFLSHLGMGAGCSIKDLIKNPFYCLKKESIPLYQVTRLAVHWLASLQSRTALLAFDLFGEYISQSSPSRIVQSFFFHISHRIHIL